MTVWSQRSMASALVLCVLCTAFDARAQLMQPDGTAVPQSDRLVIALRGEGETIDPQTEAAITPETFSPKCELSFTVIARGGGFRNSFGWYNVDPNRIDPPALSELHEFIRCDDVVGTTRTFDLRNDIRYLGGEIAFFQATTEGHAEWPSANCVDFANPDNTLGYLYFSESRFNPDGAASSSIHLLTMDSRVFDNAFYFGWEDLYTGGDNDFEDLLMRVEGVQCSGGGTACETGLQGVCADGVKQCRSGVLQCVESREPSNETCNVLDDDCDGASDEGDDLCEPGEICDRGVCIGGCGVDAFCPDGLECADNGRCIDPACAAIECEAGMVCVDGACIAPCAGVVCPFGQHCRSGLCVDQCLGGCDAGQVCDQGVCISCDCDRCSGSRVCALELGMCVEPVCANMTCADGAHCVGGMCVDDCQDVICPRGFSCDAGACVVRTDGGGVGGSAGAGGLGGSAGSGGVGGSAGASGIGGVNGGSAGAAGNAGMAAGTGGFSGGASPPSSDGCSCHTVGTAQGVNAAWFLLALAAIFVRRPRKRPSST